jgi:hypothetical protein
LPVALVVRCRRRSSKKARRLVADISEPVHWKLKKKKVGLSSIVKTKFASTSSYAIPKCLSCELAQARQRSPKVKQVQSNLDSEGAISCAILKCQSCELARARQRSPKVRQVQSKLDSEGSISRNRNEELIRNREEATKDIVPTPATQGGHVPDIPLPYGALMSDDDDSFISDTESEGGFSGANADDNGSEGAIPNEGAQGPNFAVDGEGWRRSTHRRDPIERLVPGANNIRGYPRLFGKLMPMVGWSVLISGHFNKVLLNWPS